MEKYTDYSGFTKYTSSEADTFVNDIDFIPPHSYGQPIRPVSSMLLVVPQQYKAYHSGFRTQYLQEPKNIKDHYNAVVNSLWK